MITMMMMMQLDRGLPVSLRAGLLTSAMTSLWRAAWTEIQRRPFTGVVMATSGYWAGGTPCVWPPWRPTSSRRTPAARRAWDTALCHVTCTCYVMARRSSSVVPSSLPGTETRPASSVSSKRFLLRRPLRGRRTDKLSTSTICRGIYARE